MKTRRYFISIPVTLASAILATLFLVACNQSQPPTAAPAASEAAAPKDVYVVFEGPWAIVADPKDANSVLVLAPKTKLHRDLYVAASNDATLAAGTYDLSVPAHGSATPAALDPSFAQAKIDAKSLQRALDDKSGRYVIRLPRPEAYVAAQRVRSRIGPSYFPDASTEQNYATSVSFRYAVSSLNGFSLAGSPDVGTFNPLLLQLETPTIRFTIDPAQFDDPKDMCNLHSRQAFRDTVKFLGLTLYIDFPSDPTDCHKTDPQVPRSTKAEAGRRSPLDREILATFDGAEPVAHYLTAAIYLFRLPVGDCKAPILFLTITP